MKFVILTLLFFSSVQSHAHILGASVMMCDDGGGDIIGGNKADGGSGTIGGNTNTKNTNDTPALADTSET